MVASIDMPSGSVAGGRPSPSAVVEPRLVRTEWSRVDLVLADEDELVGARDYGGAACYGRVSSLPPPLLTVAGMAEVLLAPDGAAGRARSRCRR